MQSFAEWIYSSFY